nr:FAD-dependent oxidoreductase [Legionella hackeliae]
MQLISKEILEIDLTPQRVQIQFCDNETVYFDCLYSALGSIKNSKLAIELNAKQKKGSLVVDNHQQTSVEGLYAVGDIVSWLNQLCVAESQAAIAATAIHNRFEVIS